MPNARRRRFSVQNAIASKQQYDQFSHIDAESEIKIAGNDIVTTKSSTKSKNKPHANKSKPQSALEIVTECGSASSVKQTEKYSHTKVNKDITASSSNIDIGTKLSAADDSSVDLLKETEENTSVETQRRRQMNRERTPLRRERHPRQHRIKVRSPKRKMAILDQGKSTDEVNNFINKRTRGTIAINWEAELKLCSSDNVTRIESAEAEERPSNHSLDDMCRICHGGDGLSFELGRLISACMCRGTVGRVHVKCLERWLTESGKSRCELCGTRYVTQRVHRYGVPRAIVMWILSHNAKQLIVDGLGIMLMSPLAVLAAWLTGRTLAGLMTQDSHVTPWPLASTFVLACMTLVCYYCWIVSAATRHALGWWVWYRSHYEVRLQLQEIED